MQIELSLWALALGFAFGIGWKAVALVQKWRRERWANWRPSRRG